jgi:AcrR family transcriptional regulator
MARPALTTHQRVSENGYRETTIADVVREARVSKSTFSAHFADEDCYVALYSAAVDNVLDAVREAHDADRGPGGAGDGPVVRRAHRVGGSAGGQPLSSRSSMSSTGPSRPGSASAPSLSILSSTSSWIAPTAARNT